MARWISPLRVQSPCLLVDPLCRPADFRDACGTPVCRSTGEMWHFFSRSKVHGRVQSPVEFRYPLLHTALLPCPRSLHALSICILGLQTLMLSIIGLQTLLAAPLLREFAAYLVSGQPSAAASICGELFNSSHSPLTSENI